jgi:hypothetical protein
MAAPTHQPRLHTLVRDVIDLIPSADSDLVGRTFVRARWVGMSVPLLALAQLVSCELSQNYPPPVGQGYEAGSVGGGGGGSLPSTTCACPTSTAADGGEADATKGTCYVDGFAENAVSFALPTVVGALGSSDGPPLASLDGTDACSGGEAARWSVIDMNGDDKPDFVVTQACSDLTIGTSSWDVYFNTGTAFSAKPASFALPTVVGALGSSGGPPLVSLDGSDDCSTGKTASWSVIDMNGDDKPDFVLTQACSDPAIGTSRWDVYFNNGSGFSANATSFALPTVSGALGSSDGPPLTSLDGSDDCSLGGSASWSVIDMNGDDKPDFVLTQACANSTIGTTSWKVYFNTGTGFSANATSFALPTVYGATGSGGGPPLTSLDGSDGCPTGGAAKWSVIDMNGDFKPDFLLTQACNDLTIGASRWDVYFNTGTGFSPNSDSFELPAVVGAVGSGGGPALTSLDGSDACSPDGSASWSVIDVNGDYKPDFLLTQACADSVVGTSRWDVYLNTGKAFSANATSFLLPTVPGARGASGRPPFTSLDGSDECALGGTATWSVLHMDVEGDLGFLLTQACTDDATGNLDWSGYLARCGP